MRRPFMKKRESYLGRKLDTDPYTNKNAEKLADKLYGQNLEDLVLETKAQLKNFLHGIELDAEKFGLKLLLNEKDVDSFVDALDWDPEHEYVTCIYLDSMDDALDSFGLMLETYPEDEDDLGREDFVASIDFIDAE